MDFTGEFNKLMKQVEELCNKAGVQLEWYDFDGETDHELTDGRITVDFWNPSKGSC